MIVRGANTKARRCLQTRAGHVGFERLQARCPPCNVAQPAPSKHLQLQLWTWCTRECSPLSVAPSWSAPIPSGRGCAAGHAVVCIAPRQQQSSDPCAALQGRTSRWGLAWSFQAPAATAQTPLFPGRGGHSPLCSLPLGPSLQLRALHQGHAAQLFALIQASRQHLGRWLAWVEATRDASHSTSSLVSRLPKP